MSQPIADADNILCECDEWTLSLRDGHLETWTIIPGEGLLQYSTEPHENHHKSGLSDEDVLSTFIKKTSINWGLKGLQLYVQKAREGSISP